MSVPSRLTSTAVTGSPCAGITCKAIPHFKFPICTRAVMLLFIANPRALSRLLPAQLDCSVQQTREQC